MSPRRAGVEGTVKETPSKGSGVWLALLPPRLCRPGQRTAIPGRWNSKTAARRALNAYIADVDRGQRAAPSGRAGGPVRRVRHVVDAYINARQRSVRAPLAVKTVRNYRVALEHQISHPRANIGNVPVGNLTAPHVSAWLDDLTRAGVNEPSITAARRVLSAALNWEVAQGRLPVNPAGLVRRETSKERRRVEQRTDPVVLPTWSEFAALVCAPERREDRLLIALLGWCGPRWAEAISLDADAVWRDRPQITISRVLVRRTASETARARETDPNAKPWVQEAPKGGRVGSVWVPRPLWEALRGVATTRRRQRPLPAPAGRLLFPAADFRLDEGDSIGVIDNSNWTKRTWHAAREEAGLTGDPSLPAFNPRRNAIKIKDLRAFTASVLLDAGASMTDAALLLRHANQRTTEAHYARAMANVEHDPARRAIQLRKDLSLTERIDALWDAWLTGFPEVGEALGIAVPRANRARNRATRGRGLRSV